MLAISQLRIVPIEYCTRSYDLIAFIIALFSVFLLYMGMLLFLIFGLLGEKV